MFLDMCPVRERKDNNLPAELLSHLIIHLNILLPEASHGVPTHDGRKNALRITAVGKKRERYKHSTQWQ